MKQIFAIDKDKNIVYIRSIVLSIEKRWVSYGKYYGDFKRKAKSNRF